ncbi:MAG: 30S ribosomal protein S18 [Legionellales bacterium]|nr:MAG: 30S ribosomal protein S18 [Legionellales bacterium]
MSRNTRGSSRTKRRKFCKFTVEKTSPDYKDPETLVEFIDPDSKKMLSGRTTGTKAKHQRALATAVKQARFLALIPYTDRHKEK